MNLVVETNMVEPDPVGVSEAAQKKKVSFRDMVVGDATSPTVGHVIPDLDLEPANAARGFTTDGIIDMIVTEPEPEPELEPVYGLWMQVRNRKVRRSFMSQDAPRQGVSSVNSTLFNAGHFEILKNTEADMTDQVGNRESRGMVLAKVSDRRGQLRIWEKDEEALTARRNRVQEDAIIVRTMGKI
ncbi:hypothetical protein V6N13_129973 [Hibiscus sabdariffa]|uniref:Uncharacterized protein n=1 Tax=Hibiscus sabdariffa TaxID=183260 RepID=A0ABR2SNJ9_9ROSI